MNTPIASRFGLAALLALVVASATGCIVSVGTISRDPYEACNATDSCSAGTSCTAANTTTTGGVSQGGSFCTAGCTSSGQCPSDVDGLATVCVTPSGTSSGQCYRTCGAGNTCPLGFTCGGPAGMTPFCVPNVTTGTCGGVGQICCSGNTCSTGNVCTTSGTCASCGSVGEPCCAGSTCTDSGAACGSDGLCGLGPYAACSSSSIGAACLGGTSTTGAVIATACQRPLIANPGADGFCSAACNGSQTECPTSGIAGRTSNCYILQGASNGQCFVDCAGGQTCPTDTVCAMVPTNGGSQVQICMPPPAG